MPATAATSSPPTKKIKNAVIFSGVVVALIIGILDLKSRYDDKILSDASVVADVKTIKNDIREIKLVLKIPVSTENDTALARGKP